MLNNCLVATKEKTARGGFLFLGFLLRNLFQLPFWFASRLLFFDELRKDVKVVVAKGSTWGDEASRARHPLIYEVTD